MEKKYISLKEASQVSGIPSSTLRRKIAEGDLTAYKPGRNLVIELKDLELFIKRSKVDCAS